MKLSKNLSLAEVTKSNTAIKHGIDNTPSDEHLKNLIQVAENIFQPVREHFGVPIAITSGYRSPVLNTRIGGSKTSDHCFGRALDLDADVYKKVTNEEIFYFIKENLGFKQLIAEFGFSWIHVAFDIDNNKKQVLEAKRIKGKTHYINF